MPVASSIGPGALSRLIYSPPSDGVITFAPDKSRADTPKMSNKKKVMGA